MPVPVRIVRNVPPRPRRIRQIKEASCPEASGQAAELALRKQERMATQQLALKIAETISYPALRAINATVNQAAKDVGIRFHRNWRVPAGNGTDASLGNNCLRDSNQGTPLRAFEP
jgi:hypothetical protein